MNVYILTIGTRGDFELFLTLGRALVRRGHGVTLGTSPFYLDRVRDAGLTPAAIGEGTREGLLQILQSLADVRDRRARTYAYYQQWLRPQFEPSVGRMTREAGRADYFVSNLKLILRRNGATMPGAAVTYDPPGSLAELDAYGTRQQGGRILDLVAMPRTLVDPEGAWPSEYHFTGFWHCKARPDWSPTAELASFLESGPPPVVVTLGSMVMFDAGRFVHVLEAALRLDGRRGVLVGGWSGITSSAASDHLISVGEVPYDWLFPRASCILHHGGCGTVAATLRAGKVSVLFPQITAQEHFGRLLERQSLATASFDLATLDPAALADSIRRAATDSIASKAAEEGARVVAGESGVETAVDRIEDHAGRLAAGN
jgi:UDP:flavonoid glycosyltransferase YjiC (YdhE family)